MDEMEREVPLAPSEDLQVNKAEPVAPEPAAAPVHNAAPKSASSSCKPQIQPIPKAPDPSCQASCSALAPAQHSTAKLFGADTLRGADVVAWCPVRQLVLVGTYSLCSGNRREGSVITIIPDGDTYTTIDTLELPGVLDMQWREACPTEAASVAMCLADGTVALLGLDPNTPELLPICRSAPVGSVLMALDCAKRSVCTAGVDGTLHVFRQNESTALPQEHQTIQAHQLECWACAWVPGTDAQVVWTGGDDAVLTGWDLRAPETSTFINRTAHESGVVEISFHPTKTGLVATGSYDERLRLWDVRQMRAPLFESSKLGDGVWRVRWHPDHQNMMALAVMRQPFQLWLTDHAATAAECVGIYGKQRDEAEAQSAGSFLGYGIDWRRDEPESCILASASFYDASMHIWSSDVDL